MCKRRFLWLTAVILTITIYHPGRHAKHYPYVQDTDVLQELVHDKAPKYETNLKNCVYDDLIGSNVQVDAWDVYRTRGFHLPLTGGEHSPIQCRPSYKTAILVPYRHRERHLDLFLNYMHPFLQHQSIHYRIFIAEQADSRPFNRAKMLNYAALIAMKEGYECLILHDVDLLPLSEGNVYACARHPRHMSSSIDVFRFNLPYLGLFGGVISIRAEQFRRINGLSNEYEGWGGEDDDFFERLSMDENLPYRFSPSLSMYTMLQHKKEIPSGDRYNKLKGALERQSTDGLNSLHQNYTVRLKQLYTHILVP